MNRVSEAALDNILQLASSDLARLDTDIESVIQSLTPAQRSEGLDPVLRTIVQLMTGYQHQAKIASTRIRSAQLIVESSRSQAQCLKSKSSEAPKPPVSGES